MPTPNHRHHFILDIWPEAVDPDQMEWRGKIQHLPSGEAYYFRDWGTLVEQLEQRPLRRCQPQLKARPGRLARRL